MDGENCGQKLFRHHRLRPEAGYGWIPPAGNFSGTIGFELKPDMDGYPWPETIQHPAKSSQSSPQCGWYRQKRTGAAAPVLNKLIRSGLISADLPVCHGPLLRVRPKCHFPGLRPVCHGPYLPGLHPARRALRLPVRCRSFCGSLSCG